MAKLRTLLLATAACGGGSSPQVDAGADAASDTTIRRGRVSVVQQSQGSAVTMYAAEFQELADAVLERRDADGGCQIRVETFSTATTVSAGEVTISDDRGASLALVPEGLDYQPLVVEGLQHSRNSLLTISAAGATVPTFTATFGFPETSVRITSPVFTPGQPILLDRSGFTTTWDPTGGSMWIVFRQQSTTTQQTIVLCGYVASAGTLTIPSTTLGALLGGLPPEATSVTIGSYNGVPATAGDYEIFLDGSVVGFTANATVL